MKKFSGVGLVVVLLVALVALPAMAKIDKAPVGKGSTEVSAALNVTSTNESVKVSGTEVGTSTSSSTMLMLGAGYFLTNAIQLGITTMANVSTSKPEGGSSSTTGMMFYGLKAAYNFQLKNSPAILPYVAVDLTGASMQSEESGHSFTATGLGYGAAGGLRYFLSRQASVNAELNYNAFSLSTTVMGTDVTFDEGTFGVFVGLSVFFGGAK